MSHRVNAGNVYNERKEMKRAKGAVKMAKIAVLLPRTYMLDQLDTILEEKPELRPDILLAKKIETSDAIEEARNAVDQGAHIIVARGVQAKMIHDYLKIPVVEVVMTTQELGLLVQEAKK